MKDFLRLLAHDLQNQIGAVDLNLQVLPTLLPSDDPAYSKIAPFVTRAQISLTDMSALLEDLQAYARSDDAVTITRCDLSAKARDGALALQSMAQAREVDLVTRIQDGVFANGCSDFIRRLFRILMGEAIRAAFPGSIVDVSVTALPVPCVEIGVSVDGIFEESRKTVALYLARQVLGDAKMILNSEAGRSSVQILFPPA